MVKGAGQQEQVASPGSQEWKKEQEVGAGYKAQPQGCTSFRTALPSKHSVTSPSRISKWGLSVQPHKPRMTFHIQTTTMGHLHSAHLLHLYSVGFSSPVFGPFPVALGQGFPASGCRWFLSYTNLGDLPTRSLSDRSPA